MDKNRLQKRPSRSLATLGSAAAVLAVAGCGGGGGDTANSDSTPATTAQSTANGSKVTIADFAYGPPTITVEAGTKLEFTNTDSTSHTATADDMTSFDSGTIAKGKTGSITVSKPGTYSYFCRFHPFMKGTVVVK